MTANGNGTSWFRYIISTLLTIMIVIMGFLVNSINAREPSFSHDKDITNLQRQVSDNRVMVQDLLREMSADQKSIMKDVESIKIELGIKSKR